MCAGRLSLDGSFSTRYCLPEHNKTNPFFITSSSSIICSDHTAASQDELSDEDARSTARSASICASSTSSSSASERRRPRQRAPGPGDSPPLRPPPTPTPSTGAFPEAPPDSPGNTDAYTESDGEAPQPGRLRRGQSLEVICEEVLGEAPLLTKPVRRRRSELIPRARLVPRRAASAAGDIRFRNSDTYVPPLTPQPNGDSDSGGFPWRHHHLHDTSTDLGMSRRPQILHVTDSATTRKLYGRCASAGGYPSESGLFDGERRYVSRSALTLNGNYSDCSSVRGGSLSRAHSYDENLGNERHYHKSRRSPAQTPQEDPFGEITEEEEVEKGAQKLVEANNNYVTWTKSSGSNKHWALLVDPTDTNTEVTVNQDVVDNRVINRILREVNSENDSSTESEAKGCVAVIAACPPPDDQQVNQSVGTLTLKKTGNSPGTGTSSPFERNSQLRKSMSTVALSEREQQMRASKPPKIPVVREPSCEDRSKAETEFDGLLQYLHDYRHGLRELLVNHNVVIIEPVRASAAESDNQERKHKQNEPKSNKTCRVTGAIIKAPGSNHTNITSSNTLPRSQKPHQPIMRRQFFYHPIKINKELVDAELPDPDTVKNARKVFEKGMRDGTNRSQKSVNNNDDKLARLLTVDTSFRQEPTKRWTDTGSLSSGVSSDLSCCETDLETSPKGCPPSCSNSSNQEVFSSGEESEQEQQKRPAAVRRRFIEDVGGNHVSEEVLQKIRACGTTVTYFGGRVISSSTGPLRSPMTMAIMDEIRRNAPSYDPNGTSFGMHQLGVKFRLVKSNSCGSRLELAGTEQGATKGNRVQVQRSNTTGGDLPPTSDTSKPKVAPRKVETQLPKGTSTSPPISVRPAHAKETAIVAPTPAVRTIIPKKAAQESQEQSIPNGVTEKNNSSETCMTSWKICKMLDDLKRTNTSKHYIDNRPKLQLPQPGTYDKFGVMEFEEFEVLET